MGNYSNNGKKIIGYTVVIAVLAVLLFPYFSSRGVRRGVKDIPEPVQTEAEGGKTDVINGFHLDISYKYAYDIKGLVISEKSYSGLGLTNKLAPKDVALAWGKVAEYNDRIDFHWHQSGRWIMWRVPSIDDLNPVGGEAGLNNSMSNNHLIPADAVVKRKIKKIKRGDYIEIKGYLVNIDGSKSNGATFYWNSSTVRDDSGDGSCEVIYVTDVDWLD